MTRLLLLATLLGACAAPPAMLLQEEDGLGDWRAAKTEPERGGEEQLADTIDPPAYPDEPPPPPARPMWGAVYHPVGHVYGLGSLGNLRYSTKGTANNRDEDVTANLARIAFAQGRAGGLILEGYGSDEDFTGNTSLTSFDLFGHSQIPLWPNKRLRFTNRPGLYYNNINLKNTGPTDVEGWSWGFRYELEAEVDIIKKPTVVGSIFANGRYGFGWGDASVGGLRESASATDYGWEVGGRVHWGRLFMTVSWVDRTNRLDGTFRFTEARYRFQGATFGIGLRW